MIGQFESPVSYEQDYYHDFAITENYYIFETISMKIDFMKMAEIMYNRQPLAFGAYFDENQPGEFHIINRYAHAKGLNHANAILKRIFRHTNEHKSFQSPPNMAFHVLNAYEEDNTVSYKYKGGTRLEWINSDCIRYDVIW